MFRRSSIAALLVLSPIAASTRPDALSIIQRSLEANARDWSAAPRYAYTEREREKSGTKTYDVEMIDGSPYRRLVAVNGHPLPRERQEQEWKKLEETIAQRRVETPAERFNRIEGYERERKRDRLLIEQLTDAMNFKLSGAQRVGRWRCYVLTATPRRGYQPPNIQSEVLTGMRGKLWIDEASYQWVKVQATVVHPVSIEGFVARVEPGTRFELEKQPVGDGVWLPRHFSMSARTKLFFLFNYRKQEEDWYSDYRKNFARTSSQQRAIKPAKEQCLR